VTELDYTGKPLSNAFTVKVRVSWEHPREHAISTVWDTQPLKWDPYGVSLSAANAPWETHGFSPPPPYYCDCSWTAKHACPGGDEGSEGFAKPDDSQCFEFCCPRETYGELRAESTAAWSQQPTTSGFVLLALPAILLAGFMVHKLRAHRSHEAAHGAAGETHVAPML